MFIAIFLININFSNMILSNIIIKKLQMDIVGIYI